MKTSHSKEIQDKTPEKKDNQFQQLEQRKYPEKVQHRDIPLNKQIERKFDEKHKRHIDDTASARQKKSEIIEGMVKNESPLSSGKQVNDSNDFHYLDTNEFNKELKIRDPSSSGNDIKLTQGFHDKRDNQTFVKDNGDTLVTSVHEKLHQKSSSELPTRFNEGVTEHLAREKAGGWGRLKHFDKHGREIPKPKSDYENEVKIIMQLEASIGREPINKAYFDGRTDILEKYFDSAKGKGSFQKLTEALENRDYKKAFKILEDKSK